MNKIINYKYLPYLIPGLGGIAMALQFLMMRTVDEKGLVTSGHFTHVISWILALIAVILVCMCVWKLKGTNRYRPNFPASMAGGIADSPLGQKPRL